MDRWNGDEGAGLDLWEIEVSFEIAMTGSRGADELMNAGWLVEETKGAVIWDGRSSFHIAVVKIEREILVLAFRVFLF